MKIDGRTLDHGTLEHLRLTACRRVAAGEKPSAVIASLGFCRTVIYKWLRLYRKKGEAVLLSRKAAGPPRRLTLKQCQKVRSWIVGKDPRQYGFDFGLWTRQIVAALILKKFKVRYCLASVGNLLRSMEITPQKPLRRAYERDPQRITKWVKKQYPQIRARARRRGAEIFFLDEAGFRSDAPLARTYGLKGHTPVVHTSGQRQKVSAISAVSPRGAFWSSVYTGMLNAERFLGFLKAFRKGRRKPVMLIVDGLPAHRAKKVARYVQGTRGGLELYFLPPYAPDLNPDEFVWNYMRHLGVSKKPLQRNESLHQRVELDLARVKKDRKLIRSFFHAKSVSYASD